MSFLLDEYLYRFSREHGLAKFLQWLDFDAPKLSVPSAKLSRITLPWKVIDIKYRKRDILDSYRLKFMSTFEHNAVDEYMKTKRDVPDFVLKHFGIDSGLKEAMMQ